MSRDALAGLGAGLRALTVRGNQLEELPDLSPLTGLEVVDLQDNPLLCDCHLLQLRRSVQSSPGIIRVLQIISQRKFTRLYPLKNNLSYSKQINLSIREKLGQQGGTVGGEIVYTHHCLPLSLCLCLSGGLRM